MKKNKNVEMKIYELLGIKYFRRLAFGTSEFFCRIAMPKMSKEEREKIFYSASNNYTIGKKLNYEGINKFKIQLIFNASIHTILNLIIIVEVLLGIGLLGLIPAFILNLYCIMLQRYNQLRINQVLERYKPRYEKQKQEVIQTLVEEDSKLPEHEYAVVNKRGRIFNRKGKINRTNIDEIINTANLEELKCYKMMLQATTNNSVASFANTSDGKNLCLVIKK